MGELATLLAIGSLPSLPPSPLPLPFWFCRELKIVGPLTQAPFTGREKEHVQSYASNKRRLR